MVVIAMVMHRWAEEFSSGLFAIALTSLVSCLVYILVLHFQDRKILREVGSVLLNATT
jgi:hypothetical protein